MYLEFILCCIISTINYCYDTLVTFSLYISEHGVAFVDQMNGHHNHTPLSLECFTPQETQVPSRHFVTMTLY